MTGKILSLFILLLLDFTDIAQCLNTSTELNPIQKIKVMVSHAAPFVICGENSLRGVDVDRHFND